MGIVCPHSSSVGLLSLSDTEVVALVLPFSFSIFTFGGRLESGATKCGHQRFHQIRSKLQCQWAPYAKISGSLVFSWGPSPELFPGTPRLTNSGLRVSPCHTLPPATCPGNGLSHGRWTFWPQWSYKSMSPVQTPSFLRCLLPLASVVLSWYLASASITTASRTYSDNVEPQKEGVRCFISLSPEIFFSFPQVWGDDTYRPLTKCVHLFPICIIFPFT